MYRKEHLLSQVPHSGEAKTASENAPATVLEPPRPMSEGPSENALLFWVKVNEVTFKLTDGELSLTPASHGKWGGYKTERALAWVIEVGWPFANSSWYARCGAQSYGPTTHSVAKRAAESLLNGTPLPQDEGARSFRGPINLHAVPVRADENSEGEWPDWLADGARHEQT